MINPQYHKGRSYMADIINEFNNKWTYRVLLGCYGGDKEEFVNMIADSWAVRDGRVEIIRYVEQIEDAFVLRICLSSQADLKDMAWRRLNL